MSAPPAAAPTAEAASAPSVLSDGRHIVHPTIGAPLLVCPFVKPDGTILGYECRFQKVKALPLSPDGEWRGWWDLDNRPLSGQDELAARLDASVIVCEGLKAMFAAKRLLPEAVCICWPGGAMVADRVDFTPLDHRKVLWWPDHDGPGMDAMARAEGRALIDAPLHRAWFVWPGEVPEGWDAADLEGEGMKPDASLPWVRAHLLPLGEWWGKAEPIVTAYKAQLAAKIVTRNGHSSAHVGEAPEEDGGPALPSWRKLGLILTEKGAPVANIENALRVLQGCPEFRGAVWFDSFHQKIFLTWRGPRREWTDLETLRLTSFMQGEIGILNLSDDKAGKALVVFAHKDERSEPRDWMNSLTWDGMSRIEQFLEDSFGADGSAYIRAASRNFWISMAARVYLPGCKVDTMPVLEGPQGILKSTALKVIGGPWFAEVSESVTSKDFYLALQGKLLLEISELDSFSRADITAVKRALSCVSDRFRAPYERSARDWPRRCVFAGTTNRAAWHSDESGARRFWPIRCTEIRLDLIKQNLGQLFAEAVVRFKAGEFWWEMPPEETARAQAERRQEDPWEEAVREFVETRATVRVPEVLDNCLFIRKGEQSKADEMRIAKILVTLGWVRRSVWDSGAKTQIRIWEKSL
ncbi:MAG: VapE domain-containing protein [Nitrospinota bacterium]